MGRLKSSVIALAAMALVLVPVAAAKAAGVPQIEVRRKYVFLKDVETKIVERTNAERERVGKNALPVNEHLTRTAEYKSLYPLQYLKTDGTVNKEHGFSTGPASVVDETETDPAKLNDAGVTSRDMFGIVKVENMAYTSGFSDATPDRLAEAIVNTWMQSAEHKDALLADYASIGVGVTMTEKGIMCVQHFSTEHPAASDAVPNPMVNNTAAAEGWFQRTKGEWSYSRNQELVRGWLNVGGSYYYMDNLGIMQTGWLQDNGKQYYLGSKGAMAKGWVQVDNQWYYMSGDGSMMVGAIDVGGKKYYMDDTTGQMKVGWFKDQNGSWRYFKSSGAMAIGWLQDDNKWYYMDANGVMKSGWEKVGNKWYYLSNSGAMARRWARLSGVWYYLGEDGAMRTGWHKVDNQWYYFKGSGAMATGWVADGGKWYYMQGNGVMKTNWQQIGNKWYYLTSSGAMATGRLKIGNTTYTFNADGSMVN